MTCAKQIVTCKIITKDGHEFIGENSCASPQSACPRMPGENYEKCKSICKQDSHAEIAAIKKASGRDLKEAIAELRGHYYSCKDCAIALKIAGIEILTVYMQ